jgi:hypothetical protein
VNRPSLALLTLTLVLARPAAAEPVEPPSDALEGADVALEAGDSLAAGEVELGLGLEGAATERPQRRKRVRFEEPDFAGTVREGAGDPLAGGAVEARAARSTFVTGKLSPRWGRGLLLGSPGEPWQRAAVESGRRDRGSSRAGEGLMIGRGEERRIELLAGRFSRRDLAGARARRGPLGIGLLGGRRRAFQSSLAVGAGADAFEAVIDGGGRWRAEGLLERPYGAWTAIACVRGGSSAFRSLAEPARSGPARALTVAASGPTSLAETRVLAGVWRYRAGVGGSRVAIECRRRLAEGGGRLLWGFEEQHGARKDAPAHSEDFRQGAWAEWAGGGDPVAITLRHESWGARAPLRDLVRTVTSARFEVGGPGGSRMALNHTAYRTRRGESLYLAEAESDRLVLRALAGEGHRSRLELVVPAGRGRLRATLLLTALATRPAAPRWTLEWIRRSRQSASRP